MLQKLTIKNIALIDCAEINFTKGLNVLSGETGAGKSVIIESLNFVLGAKADKTLIRSGTAECLVQAVFDISKNNLIHNVLKELDIEDDEMLIISRKFSIDGKSSIRVNGVPIAVSMLRKITTPLVDVHGQSEHFYLLKSSNQLDLIDKFGGEVIKEAKEKVFELFSARKKIVEELNKFGGNEQERQIKLDILKYQVREIEDCNLQQDEEENLKAIKQKISNQEKIVSALNLLKQSISEENGVNDVIYNAIRSVNLISEYSSEYNSLSERLNDVVSELEDISDTATNLLDDFDIPEYDANFIEERLERIKNIKKKYGQTHEEIIKYLENSKTEIDKLENFNEIADKLNNELKELQEKLYTSYIYLSKQRKVFADKFSKNVLVELKELGMPKANFNVKFGDEIAFENCEFNSSNGIDTIEFLFSANNGEPLKPLSFVISGGEMSRFMLSIKAQTAKHNDISTFIFDEIDSGISGVTAKVVAEKFAKISKDVQIIAISHLPQISSMADNNLLITKTENYENTTTQVKTLVGQDKVHEIIRLIGGSSDSESAILHAKELILQAENYKKTL